MAAQVRSVCVTISASERDHFWQRIRPIYRDLLLAGYEIPLCLVLDLAILYEYGSDSTIYPSSQWPAANKNDSHLANLYCGALRQGMQGSNIQGIMKAGSAQSGKRHPDGVRTFLEVAASGLCRIVQEQSDVDGRPRAEVDRDVLAAIRDGKLSSLSNRWSDLCSLKIPDPPEEPSYWRSVDFRDLFLKHLLQGRIEKPFTFAFSEEARRQLVRIGGTTPRGAEGTDLLTLQACNGYAEIEMSRDQEGRYQHLRRVLSAGRPHSSRSPDTGNHGIRRNGSPSSVLRTVLVHDDFIDRIYLKQAFYYDRRSTRQEPHRLLMGWILDQSLLMKELTEGGIGTDTRARQITAYLLEDAARMVGDIPAIDLQVAVTLYDSRNNRNWPRVLPVSREELRVVAERARNTDSNALTGRAWLPNLRNFVPDFFLRTPSWPDRYPARQAKNLNDRDSLRNAIKELFNQASMLPLGGGTGTTKPFHVCCLTVIGADGGVQSGELTNIVPPGRADRIILCRINCGKEGMSWDRSPATVRSRADPSSEAYTSGLGANFQPIARQVGRSVLLDTLQSL